MSPITKLIRFFTAWAWVQERIALDASVKFAELHSKPGEMELWVESHPGFAQAVAQGLAAMVARAPNYVEMQFHPPAAKTKQGWEYVSVNVVKHNGETPHQLRLRAESERDAAILEVKVLKAELCELNEFTHQLERDIEESKDITIRSALDWATEDIEVKRIAKPYIGDFDRPNEAGIGFRGTVAVVNALVDKLNQWRSLAGELMKAYSGSVADIAEKSELLDKFKELDKPQL